MTPGNQLEKDRKEALSLPALQCADAFLVALAFWIPSLLWAPVREALGLPAMGDVGLRAMPPVIIFIIPLTPLVLNWFGFYRNPLQQRFEDSRLQVIKAGIIVGVVVGVLVLFLRVQVYSRWVLATAIPFTAVLLIGRAWLVQTIGQRHAPMSMPPHENANK